MVEKQSKKQRFKYFKPYNLYYIGNDGMKTNKMEFAFLSLILPFLLLSIIPNSISSNTINSITTSQTPIPAEYKAVIYIVIFLILIFLVLKFFGTFIKLLIIMAIAYLLITILIGVINTGTLTLQYSFSYAGVIWNFITGASHTIHTIENISNTISTTSNSLS